MNLLQRNDFTITQYLLQHNDLNIRNNVNAT